MTCAQTYAWIFYAVGLAGQKTPATAVEVEQAADGINHAVPTQREMLESISWCVAHGLVEKEGKFLTLTQIGSTIFNEARLGARTISGVWKLLEKRFAKMGVDDSMEINPRTMKTSGLRCK